VFCQRQEADTRPGINSDLMVIFIGNSPPQMGVLIGNTIW
jgi:hypothetical protein